MKQIQLSKPGGLENLKLTDTENPSPKDNEVLLKVHASSLNYHDLNGCSWLDQQRIKECHCPTRLVKF